MDQDQDQDQDLDQEREHLRKTYQLCRLGFGLLSAALVLAAFCTVIGLSRLFVGPFPIAGLLRSSLWHWRDAPIVWGSLLGCYLLWGRWPQNPSWQRRSGLLVLMCVGDAILWFLDYGGELGLRLSEVGHEWLRHLIGAALGWAEFAVIASLAGDLMAHFGLEQAPDAARSTRSLAATGAAVWFLYFLERTAWGLGWPLQQQPFFSIEGYLLFLGFQMIWTITLIQATVLTIATARQSTRVLADMAREDQDHDLLKPPSDSHLGLLASRHDEHQ